MNHEIDCYYVFNWSVELMVMDDFFWWFVEYIEGIIWIKAFYKYVIFHDDGSEKRDLEGIIGMNNPF